MKIVITRTSSKEKIFMTAWLIYLTAYVLLRQVDLPGNQNVILKIYRLAQLSALVLCFILAISNKYAKKKLCFLILISLTAICGALYSHDFTILFAILFIISAGYIRFSVFVKFDLTCRILLFFVILMLNALNVIQNQLYLINGTYKNTLGFLHPNTLGIFCCIILLEWIYLRFEKIRWIELALIGLLLYGIYLVCSSRASVYAMILVLMLFCLFKMMPRLLEHRLFFLVKLFLIYLAPFCAVISIILSQVYTPINRFFYDINLMLTGRIAAGQEFLQQYGISIFGQTIHLLSSYEAEKIGKKAVILDNAYLKLGIEFGLITLLILMISYVCLQKYTFLKKDYALLICSTFFILEGIFENHILIIAVNFTLFSLSHFIFNRRCRKNV